MTTARISDPQPQPRGARGPYRSGVLRREQILDAAVEVFGRHGYVGGSMRRIAELVGVSHAALSRHFATKDELLTAVLERSDAANGAAIATDGDPLSELDAFARLVSANGEHRALVALLLTMAAEASDPDHPARTFMAARYARTVENVSHLLVDAGAAGQTRLFSPAEAEFEARAFVALMDGLQLQWLLDPRIDLASTVATAYAAIRDRWVSGPEASRR
ncbi:TetR/AcrR family transcriptional regulator [Demequina silvatica]|uniref:TetR/AcrR family transcriptional regulator n=1 Tax=Demequina silvatica TaxID=1638988 RepID=UPI00078053FE|nr:TetR/AcrR family transcriptional regulator [Demequina silvatica]